MKKLLCTALILSLVLGMGTLSVFAASGSTTLGPGTGNIDVTAVYNDGTTAPISYSVDVVWEAMEFSYNISGTNVWNSATHSYTPQTTTGWSTTGNDITVTNHSNAPVRASFSYAQVITGVTGSFSLASFDLPSAERLAVTDPSLTNTTELTLGGTLSDTVTSSSVVGRVTVTLAAVN